MTNVAYKVDTYGNNITSSLSSRVCSNTRLDVFMINYINWYQHTGNQDFLANTLYPQQQSTWANNINL